MDSQDTGPLGRSKDATLSSQPPPSLFKGIEGTRGWLAWAVVATHISVFTGLTKIVPHGVWLHIPGDDAVRVFIIISGFVITHLVLTKAEPYGLYIARRFLRIFPAYLVCLAIGILIAPLSVDAVETYRYSEPYQLRDFLIVAQQYHHHLWAHIVAHLLLLQGVLSNHVLPQSQMMFLPPAWSLSLEWQFYLVAPAWIYALRRFPVVTVIGTLVAWQFWNRHLSGGYVMPSALPASGLYFLIGMASRLLIKYLPKTERYPFAEIIACAALALLDKDFIPLVVWVALVAYFQQPKTWPILDGALAKAAGARSYSVYLLHIPLIYLGLYLSARVLHLSLWWTEALSIALTVLGVLIGSELIFRYVETPAINFARSLGGQDRDERVLKEKTKADPIPGGLRSWRLRRPRQLRAGED